MKESLFFISSDFDRTKPNTILRQLPIPPTFISIRVNKTIKKIFINNIVRIEASSNYSLIYLQNSCYPIVSAKTLKYYRNLIGLKDFLYPHKSHMINKKHINSYSFKDRPYLQLNDNSNIPISRRKIKGVKRVLLTNRNIVQ